MDRFGSASTGSPADEGHSFGGISGYSFGALGFLSAYDRLPKMPVSFRPFGSHRVDRAATGAGRLLSSGPFGSPTGSLAWADLASLTYAPFPSAAMRLPLCGFPLRRKPTKDPDVDGRITPPPPPRQEFFSPAEQSFRVGPPPEGGNLLFPRETPLATRSLAGPWKALPHQHPNNTPTTRGVSRLMERLHGANGSGHRGGRRTRVGTGNPGTHQRHDP